MPSCWPPAAWPSLPCSTSCSDPGRRIRPTAKASAAPCGGRLFCVRGPGRCRGASCHRPAHSGKTPPPARTTKEAKKTKRKDSPPKGIGPVRCGGQSGATASAHRMAEPAGGRALPRPGVRQRRPQAPGTGGTLSLGGTPCRRTDRKADRPEQRPEKDDRLPRGRGSRPKREDVLMVRGYGEGGGCSCEPRQDQGGSPCRIWCPPEAGRGYLGVYTCLFRKGPAGARGDPRPG